VTQLGETSVLDKVSFAAIFIVLMLMPLVGHAGGLGVAPLMFILGFIGLIRAIKTKQFKITNTQIALFVLLVWLCITALWSPYRPDDLLTNYIKLVVMVLIYYWSWILFQYVGRIRPKPLQTLMIATSFFAAGLLVIDLLTRFGVTFLFHSTETHSEKIFRAIDAEGNLGHSITILVLIAAPIATLIRDRLPSRLSLFFIIIFFALILWAAWLNNLAVGILGLASVVVAMSAGRIFPHKVPSVLLGLAIVLIMAAPLLAYFSFHSIASAPDNIPMSWDHRLRMWGYCWQVIVDHPLKGVGFDASRTFSETYTTRDGRDLTIVSLHPHNAGIQIWTEAGLIGALLASGVIATLFKPINVFIQNRGHAGAVSGVIMAGIIISSLTYGAWQFWWWGSLFFAVGVLYLLPISKSDSFDKNPQEVQY